MNLANVALATLQAVPNNPILVLDASATCVAAFGSLSANQVALFGPLDAYPGRSAERLTEGQGEPLRALVEAILADGRPRTRRAIVNLDGGRFAFQMRLWRVPGHALVACQVDRAEDASDSDRRLEAYAAQSAHFVCEVNEAGAITYVGARARELGVTPEALVGRSIRELSRALGGFDLSDDESRREVGRFLSAHSDLDLVRTRWRDASGQLHTFATSGAWYTSASGERRGILIFRDLPADEIAVTARSRALRNLADQLVDAVIELTPEGQILATTPLPEAWAGAGTKLEGRSLFELIHPADVERARHALASPRNNLSPEPGIYRWAGARGGWRSVETRAVAYAQESGGARLIAVGRDVTHESAEPPDAAAPVENQASPLDANLTLLAGGVAHDFNNLLTVSLGVTDLISEQLPSDSPARAYLSELVAASRHAADLARQLLAVTGRHRTATAPLDLNAVVGGVLRLFSRSVPQNVQVHVEPSPEALWVDGDAAQLRQVLLNLVSNAGEAIGARGGNVRITLSHAQGSGEDDDAGRARIEVEDDGPGIEPAARARIFEPAFTTKATGHGLGLAVVQSVIRRHRGEIRVDGGVNGGTVFRIELPLLPAAVVAVEQRLEQAIRETPTDGGGVVLIVDDDPAVRRVSAAMLGLANFRVLEAPDAITARDFAKTEAVIDCAVVDLVMPDADGLALVDELRAIRPGLKVLICSGAIDRIPAGRSDVDVLEKPFRYAQLIEAVWQTIASDAEDAASVLER